MTLKESFRPGGLTTMVGSLPHRDPEQACRLVFEFLEDCPTWPQLPRRSFKENMTVQYSGGMPALVLDEAGNRIYFKIGDDLLRQLEEFYGRIIEDDVDYFAIGPEYAAGLEAFIRLLPGLGRRAYLKGCVVGPVTFGMTVTDDVRRPAFYHPEISDAVTKVLAMKARWQVRLLRPFCDRVIIFIDEPYLAAVGSAVINLKKEEVVRKIGEVVEAVHGEGALAGIHCCANTDWSVPMETGVDILNFDAFGFGRNLLLYRPQLRRFIDAGGVLAWGIVPAGETARAEGFDSLRRLLLDYWRQTAEGDVADEKVRSSAMITPSCGLGTLTPELSRTVLKVLKQFADEFSERRLLFGETRRIKDRGGR